MEARPAEAKIIYRYFKQRGHGQNAIQDPLLDFQQLLLLINRILPLLARR
jgi:hypothetical protein